jgi:catechol 2,3-dioxygenase-like lactoylglutathione lyase family enzyme
MAHLIRVAPYADDERNLPVANVETALPFYLDVMRFHVVSRAESPTKKIILERDGLEIGLAENGGDPSQEGCFFEVDSVADMFAELKANGLKQDQPKFRIDKHGDVSYEVFFVVAPDGLCYCLGQRQPS